VTVNTARNVAGGSRDGSPKGVDMMPRRSKRQPRSNQKSIRASSVEPLFARRPTEDNTNARSLQNEARSITKECKKMINRGPGRTPITIGVAPMGLLKQRPRINVTPMIIGVESGYQNVVKMRPLDPQSIHGVKTVTERDDKPRDGRISNCRAPPNYH
jgi:hypothetical protein